MQQKNDRPPLSEEQPLMPAAPTPLDVVKKPLTLQEIQAGIELHSCFGMISCGSYREPVTSVVFPAAV